MSERRLLKSLMLFVSLSLIATVANAAGKCERLVATGNPEYPPYLWRDPQNPKQLIGANADLLKHARASCRSGTWPTNSVWRSM